MLMFKSTHKTSHISDREFKIWLDQFCDQYGGVLKKLARMPYRVASDKEVKRAFSNLEKRYKGLYDDLAKT